MPLAHDGRVSYRTDAGKLTTYILLSECAPVAYASTLPMGPTSTSFRLGEFMKNLLVLIVGTSTLAVAGLAMAQNGNMMNGSGWGMGWMGGYGGIWGLTLLVVVVAVVVALVMQRKGK